MPINVTEHFTVEEFACHDGTPYPIATIDIEDPQKREWVETRLAPLCKMLEVIRHEAGAHPMTIDSGFRTIAYDTALYEKSAKDGSVAPPQSSQHPKGRAADIKHSTLGPRALHDLIVSLIVAGKLPLIGGVGLYPTFVHIDVRPKPASGHVAQWGGDRSSNIL